MQGKRHGYRAAVGALLLILSGHTWACTSFEGLPVFEPNVKAEGERLFRPEATIPGELQEIVARVVSLRRADPRNLCGPSARIKVAVEWARPTDVRLQDIGIYFKVLSGTSGTGAVKYYAFNSLPRVVTVEDGVAYVYLQIADSDESSRGPIDLEVEVFAVDKLLRIGPSSRLSIRS
ncbi:MAG TPA: hypothetical protein VM469_12225 [Pseudoxanthomonas sp.]|jgi:hypothetical protein|nr:hypothetical protein [Pseudoxanthomonas sp.]